jgi:sensor histidine kinase YesM
MAAGAPGGISLKTMLAAFAALCALRPMQFGVWILTMHGVTLESLAVMAEFGCSMFICGLPGFALVAWMDRRTLGEPLGARMWKVGAALALGALGFGILFTLLGYVVGHVDTKEISTPAYVAMFSLWMLTGGGLLTAILLFIEAEALTTASAHEAQLAAVRRQREWDEIRLRFLRTQIEPHFLFNALANVKRLYETDPRGGRGLLRALADYLELALASDRMCRRTVDDEVALTRAYLDIFAVRMGERLRVQLDVPEDLRGAPMPPLMLGTLVENALKHGIGPRAAGGSIRVEVRRDGADLVARVADDGVGFRDASGNGVGLSNTRERLATLFGDRGRLDLARNPGGGVVATLRMPLEPAS